MSSTIRKIKIKLKITNYLNQQKIVRFGEENQFDYIQKVVN